MGAIRPWDQRPLRHDIFAELTPVTLSNCWLKRFGEVHDSGYVLCDNLLEGVQTAYPYGIGGHDQWRCDVSTAYRAPVHEYDCFTQDPSRATAVPLPPRGARRGLAGHARQPGHRRLPVTVIPSMR